MHPLSLFPFLLAPAALVAAAEAPVPLPLAAARELAEMKDFLATRALPAAEAEYTPECRDVFKPRVDECLALIASYEATGDIGARSAPHELTLLHLACLMHKPELARALLAAGAPPRARAYDPKAKRRVDAPLESCVREAFPGLPQADAAARIALIDMLVAAGADVSGLPGRRALLAAGMADYPGAEDVALHLLGLVVDPYGENEKLDKGRGRRDTWIELLFQQKTRLLEALLGAGFLPPLEDAGLRDAMLLLILDNGEAEDRAAGIAWLLQHGANLQGEASGDGGTAADLIHGQPRLLAALAARGINVPRTPRTLRAESIAADLDALPPDANPPCEDLAPHWDALAARLLAPEPTKQRVNDSAPMTASDSASVPGRDIGELWQHATQPKRTSDLRFLTIVDAARAADFIMQQPMWQAERPWAPREAMLFGALLECDGLRLPADFIVRTAERFDAAGKRRVAHELIHLLARNVGDAASRTAIEKLCEDARPALVSAARSVRLELAGISPLPNYTGNDRSWGGEGQHARIHRLNAALVALTFNPDMRGHFIDFSRAPQADIYLICDIPGLVASDDEPLSVNMGWGCTPAERDELLRTLRELRLEEAADYVEALFLAQKACAGDAPTTLDDDEEEETDPDADYEEPDYRTCELEWGYIDQLRSLAESPEAEKHAYAIEAALERLLWELHQKNSE